MMGCNTFNLGSSRQLVDESFLLIKEAVEHYNVRRVYLDLSYRTATRPLGRGEPMTSIYLITDYMRPSLKRTHYLLIHSASGDLANSFLIARRNWQKLFNPQYVGDLLRTKRGDAYREYQYVHNPNESYAGKGYICSYNTAPSGGFIETFEETDFDLQTIPEQWAETVLEMIRYCRENDVELTFISIPIPAYRILCFEEYDDYIALVNKLLAQYGDGVKYIDFNLKRPEYWPKEFTLYSDSNHLNHDGARLFSEIFCRYVAGEISDEELFYPSAREKLADLQPGFYGLEVTPVLLDEWVFDCRMMVSSPETFESRAVFSGEDGETVLKEKSKSLSFRIPAFSYGDCCIKLLFDDGTKKEYVLTFDYDVSVLMMRAAKQ